MAARSACWPAGRSPLVKLSGTQDRNRAAIHQAIRRLVGSPFLSRSVPLPDLPSVFFFFSRSTSFSLELLALLLSSFSSSLVSSLSSFLSLSLSLSLSFSLSLSSIAPSRLNQLFSVATSRGVASLDATDGPCIKINHDRDDEFFSTTPAQLRIFSPGARLEKGAAFPRGYFERSENEGRVGGNGKTGRESRDGRKTIPRIFPHRKKEGDPKSVLPWELCTYEVT